MSEPVDFLPLFQPQAVAVVGASSGSGGVANNFLRNLRTLGYPGRVYPVHPSAETIEGWRAYQSLAALPAPVDYAYVAVAAERTPGIFEGASGQARFVQVISSGFAEAGAADLQQQLVAACHSIGARLLGPNCLGLHSPSGHLSFIDRVSMEVGAVGVLSQSGGLGVDILRRGQVRGLRFSGLVTLGNSADLNACDLLEYFLADPGTRVIGLYLEMMREGRRFFEILRAARAAKPVVILKGGRTEAGQRASSSHTGALAQDDRLWTALARQTGSVLVDTLDRFIDALLAFQQVTPRSSGSGPRVILFGNGGGTSVLASDAFSRAGFQIHPLGQGQSERLLALKLPPGSSIENPIDTPAGTLRQEDGAVGARILEVLYSEPDVAAIVMHLNMPVILSYSNPNILPNLVNGALEVQARAPRSARLVLVLRSDGELDIEAERQRYRGMALGLGIPVFDELASAADALRCLAEYETFLSRRLD